MTTPTYSTWYLESKELQPWVFLDNVFTEEECDKIIDIGNSLQRETAKVVSSQFGLAESNIRKNSVSWINSNNPEHHWIFQRCAGAVFNLNKQFYNFNLEYIECLQYTIYDKIGDHYDDHLDNLIKGIHYRKLSFSVQLDSPDNYDGCDLVIKTGAADVNKEQKRTRGTMVAFPSFMLHEVTPLLNGQRRSLVGWVCGPTFK
jgi:PKHD-type hydroxylase